jgi:hypothetical protein
MISNRDIWRAALAMVKRYGTCKGAYGGGGGTLKLVRRVVTSSSVSSNSELRTGFVTRPEKPKFFRCAMSPFVPKTV